MRRGDDGETSVSEIERIQDQLRRSYEGPAWHGPSLRELLEGVSDEMARARPVAAAHTIREIILHVLAWLQEATRRLEGQTTELPPERDWPEGDAAWASLLKEVEVAQEQLLKSVEKLDEDALGRIVGGNPATAYHLLHGVVQHNLYHGGQIAILKKAVSK